MVDLTLDKAQKWLSKSAAMDKRGVTKDLKKVVTYIKRKLRKIGRIINRRMVYRGHHTKLNH